MSDFDQLEKIVRKSIPPNMPPPPKFPRSPHKVAGWKIVLAVLAGCILVFTVSGVGTYYYFSKTLPQIISITDYRPPGVTRIITYDGGYPTLIGEFYKEYRQVIPYSQIPERVVNAFISAEDDTFFQHQGISLAAMLRAAIVNFKAGHVVQGGSTITQQVAKSLFLTSERSFIRKFKEAILAGRIEKNLTKEQILYLYLNQIYLGHGAYGVQAASQRYFHKDISRITNAEAAFLAAMTKAPSKFSPLTNPARAKERQKYVLKRMYENKFITEEKMQSAGNEPVKFFRDEDRNLRYSPYYVEHIRRHLIQKYGEKALYEDGLTVVVPARLKLLEEAGKYLRQGLRDEDKRRGFRGSVVKLKNDDEIKEFLDNQQDELLEKRVPYMYLLGDGTLSKYENVPSKKVAYDVKFLDAGERYKAVVLGVNDAKSEVTVKIGATSLLMTGDTMKWAFTESAPIKPSLILSRGDVIWVQAVKNMDTKGRSTADLRAALDQEPLVQGSIFSVEARTGNVLAMDGGYDFNASEFNRAIQAQRQPGSAFKPIIYSASVEKGYTPASIIVDSPIVFRDQELGDWKPANFEEKFYGDTTFLQAFFKSRNIPTVKLVQEYQVPPLVDFARRLGMTGCKFNQDLSIALGSAACSLVELTQTYALFPRLGKRVNSIFVSKVTDRDGKILEENVPEPLPELEIIQPAQLTQPVPLSPAVPVTTDPSRPLDPKVAYVMIHMMKEVVLYGTGSKANVLGRPLAGKTGTTNDFRDAWFIGFSPYVVTGVWVGFDDQQLSLGQGETGASVALPIWINFMREANIYYPADDFPVPAGITFVPIDVNTGQVLRDGNPEAHKVAFISGTEPVKKPYPAGGGNSGNSGEFLKEGY